MMLLTRYAHILIRMALLYVNYHWAHFEHLLHILLREASSCHSYVDRKKNVFYFKTMQLQMCK